MITPIHVEAVGWSTAELGPGRAPDALAGAGGRPSSTSSSSAAASSARAPRSTPRPAGSRSRWSRPATGRAARRAASSKLVHGGLRYLEMLDFGLVREALRERGLLLHRTRAAPRPAGAVPLSAEAPRLGAALRRRRRDALRPSWPAVPAARGLPRHRHLTRRQALRARARACGRRPGRRPSSTTTRRSTTPATRSTLARTAAAYGALVASRARVVGFLREGGARRRRPGARPRDAASASRSGPSR